MRDDDIPVKTDEGLAEIKTRALGLAPRMRTALLLVDGVKSVRELEQLLASSGVKPGALQMLLEKGLISLSRQEAVSVTVAPPAPATPPEAASRPPVAPPPEAAPAPAVVPQANASAPLTMSGSSHLSEAPVTEPPRTAATAPKIATVPKAAPVAEAEPARMHKAAPPPEPVSAPKTAPMPKPPAAVAMPVAPKTAVAPRPAAEPITNVAPAPKAATLPIASAAPALPPAALTPIQLPQPPQSISSIDDEDEPADEVQVFVPPPPPEDMKLLIARAHLANALDDQVSGYVLRQMVASCSSRAELESLFDAADKVLKKSLGNAQSTRVLGIAKALLRS